MRRCTMVTDRPNFVRNSASSRAESPPPTTTMGLSRKKKPSQVAHVETPCPISRASFGRPSNRERAPVAMMSVFVRTAGSDSSPAAQISMGEAERLTRAAFSTAMSAPKRSAWARICCISSGPMTPSANPGKFSTSVVNMS